MFQLVCVVPVMVIALYIFSSVKILRGYERGVVFRLGRVLAVPRGPGIALVFAPVDRMVRMLLRASRM
jgi:regulator of protease activity HflC (stomatin/prohibitin superfamily)